MENYVFPRFPAAVGHWTHKTSCGPFTTKEKLLPAEKLSINKDVNTS